MEEGSIREKGTLQCVSFFLDFINTRFSLPVTLTHHVLINENILADYYTGVDFDMHDRERKRTVGLHQVTVEKRNLPSQVSTFPPLVLLPAAAQNLTRYLPIQNPTLMNPSLLINTTTLSEVHVALMELISKDTESVIALEAPVEEA